MTLLMIFGFLAAALFVYAIIQSRATLHQYYIIPTALATVIGIVFFYNTVLGYPTTALNSKEFEYLSYHTDGETIWIWVKHDDEDEPRSYAKPYTEQTQAELEAGDASREQGKTVRGEFMEEEIVDDENDGSFVLGSSKSAGGALELYDLDPAKYLPQKNPQANNPPAVVMEAMRQGVTPTTTSMGGP